MRFEVSQVSREKKLQKFIQHLACKPKISLNSKKPGRMMIAKESLSICKVSCDEIFIQNILHWCMNVCVFKASVIIFLFHTTMRQVFPIGNSIAEVKILSNISSSNSSENEIIVGLPTCLIQQKIISEFFSFFFFSFLKRKYLLHDKISGTLFFKKNN